MTAATSASQPAIDPRKAADRRTILAVSLFAAMLGAIMWHMHGYYFWAGHDEYYPLYRTQQMVESWRGGGGFRTLWFGNGCFGYGWPFFLFYAPFGYYISSALHWLFGFDLGLSVRISFFLSIAASGAVMGGLGWLLARRSGSIRPEFWGLAAATLVTFAPYHMADVFVRSALAECWAWPFFAAALLGAEAMRTRPSAGGLLFTVAVAGLILSHNIMAMYGCLTIAAYALLTAPWSPGGARWLGRMTVTGGFGVALAAWFWLPAVSMIDQVRAADVDGFFGSPEWLWTHALFWPQLFMEQWNFGSSRAGMDDTLPLNPGLLQLFGGLVAGVALWRGRLPRDVRRSIAACLILSLLLLFATTHAMPWHWTPSLLRYIQFPWRLALLVVILLAMALTGAAGAVERRLSPWVFIIPPAVIALWMLASVVVRPTYDLAPRDDVAAWNLAHEYRDGIIAGCNFAEYLPATAAPHFVDRHWQAANPPPRDRIAATTGTLAVHAYGREGPRYRWLLDAAEETAATVHLFDFPGWILKIDGVPANERLARTADGLIALGIPAGEHEIVLKYTEPPIVPRAARISWTALLLLVLWIALERRWARRRARGASADA